MSFIKTRSSGEKQEDSAKTKCMTGQYCLGCGWFLVPRACIVHINSISHNPPEKITGEEWELSFGGSFFTYFFFSWQIDCFLSPGPSVLCQKLESLQVTCEMSVFLAPEGRVRKVMKYQKSTPKCSTKTHKSIWEYTLGFSNPEMKTDTSQGWDCSTWGRKPRNSPQGCSHTWRNSITPCLTASIYSRPAYSRHTIIYAH